MNPLQWPLLMPPGKHVSLYRPRSMVDHLQSRAGVRVPDVRNHVRLFAVELRAQAHTASFTAFSRLLSRIFATTRCTTILLLPSRNCLANAPVWVYSVHLYSQF